MKRLLKVLNSGLALFLLLITSSALASKGAEDNKNGYILKFQFDVVPHYTVRGDQMENMFKASTVNKKIFPIPIKYIPSDTSLVMVEIDGKTYYFDRFDIKHKGLPDIGKNLESCESLIAAAESTDSNLGGYRAAADDCASR